ncbi:MAG: hypothetical protein WD740_01480 [Anaerolineales bacterium]
MAVNLHFHKPSETWALRLALLFSALLGAAALWQFKIQLEAEGLIETSANFRAGLYGGVFLVATVAVLAMLAWTPLALRLLVSLNNLQIKARRLGAFALVIYIFLLGAFPFIVLGFYGRFLVEGFPRLFLFWSFAVLGATFLAAWRKTAWLANLPVALLALSSVYLAATFFYQVQGYPFSLEWSEVSRYYQASFYFSQQVYGIALPLPITHPSRYLLQALPFLISNSPLWLHRLWQALLWVGLPLLTAWILARRLRLQPNALFWSFIVWVFLFLMQGAVFYHLLPCVFLVLLGFDKERPWRTFLFVVLASLWAGISRINWVPLPGALAALLYLLEARPARSRTFFSFGYLWQPAFYAIGGSLVALGAYALYIVSSGNPDPGQFASPFTSALLWERLWPNVAFPLGILPGILLVSAPLLVMAWLRLRQSGAGLGLWRSLGVAVLLLIFFAGGLVVSVKIGGGTNLHNLDAYLVLLLVAASALTFGLHAPLENRKKPSPLRVPPGLLAALILIPIFFAVISGAPLELPERQVAGEVLAQIRAAADTALADGGEVLFISQRHLVTFQLVDNVPLVHEYEKLFLMEMAISHNDPYLSRFAKDIDQQRFALIVTDPLYNNISNVSQDPLAPENNAWVRNVGRPLLCAYEAVATFSNPAIQLLTPRYGDKCNQ